LLLKELEPDQAAKRVNFNGISFLGLSLKVEAISDRLICDHQVWNCRVWAAFLLGPRCLGLAQNGHRRRVGECLLSG
jgi:hypothetical protein